MSSYLQRTEPTTIAEAIEDGGKELSLLWNEMSQLCAGIAAQFPDTYEEIPKYREALVAHDALMACVDLFEQIETWGHGKTPIMVTVGKQTRRGRSVSQRVRLANAIVRLTEAADTLHLFDTGAEAEALLREIIETVDGITFPATFG